jgi:hypothetical protein
MKPYLIGLVAASMVSFYACSPLESGPQTAQKSSTTSEPAATPVYPTDPIAAPLAFPTPVAELKDENSFKLEVPILPAKVAQGETTTLSIAIQRGERMDHSVTLDFSELPAGVTIDPLAPTIKQGETKVDVKLTATSNATVGQFTAKVTGMPSMGLPDTREIGITVQERV